MQFFTKLKLGLIKQLSLTVGYNADTYLKWTDAVDNEDNRPEMNAEAVLGWKSIGAQHWPRPLSFRDLMTKGDQRSHTSHVSVNTND